MDAQTLRQECDYVTKTIESVTLQAQIEFVRGLQETP